MGRRSRRSGIRPHRAPDLASAQVAKRRLPGTERLVPAINDNGKQAREVGRMFVGHGLLPALIGLGLGLAAAFGLTRLMSSLLFGVTALDPLACGASVALLMAASRPRQLPSRPASGRRLIRWRRCGLNNPSRHTEM